MSSPSPGFSSLSQVFVDSVSSPSTQVQVMFVSCSYGSCAAGVALTHEGHNVTVLPSPQNALPDVYMNGTKLLLPANRTFSPTFRLTMISVTTLTFTLGTVDLDVVAKGGYVEVVVKANTSTCTSSGGLLDVCGTPSQSLYNPVSSKSLKDLHEKIETDFKVTGSEVLFQLSAQKDPFSSSAASYSLSFNGTSAWSKAITLPSSVSALQDFTISLHVRPKSYGGTVLSFGKNSTFAITNDSPLKIQCGGREVDTGLSLTLDRWNQLIVTVLQSEQNVHVFVYNEDTTIQHKVLPQHCETTVVHGVVVSLGEWVPSPDDSPRELRESFNGEVDELVVWSTAIPTAVVFQVYAMDVDVSAFRSVLASLLKLNEGLGTVAHDNLLSSNDLLLPSSPWPSPVWALSDLQLQSSSRSEVASKLPADQTVIQLCDAFFTSASVTTTCSIKSLVWFRAKCLDFAAAAGSSEGAVVAMATFINVCSVSGADVTTIYRALCDTTPNIPPWLQRRCTDCAFGSLTDSVANSTFNMTCSCLPGFWGPGCHSNCPGGHHNPCNGQGRCSDEDGVCWCDRHWAGTDCSSCAPGWEGESCIISTNFTTTASTSAVSVVGQVTPLGRVITFDGVTFDILKYGLFNLVHDSSSQTVVAIQVVPCTTGLFSSHCVGSLIVGSESNRLEISHKGFGENKITLFADNSELVVRGSLTVGKLKFVYASFSTLKVSTTDRSLNITVIVVNTNLLVTVSAQKSTWFTGSSAVFGLMASCNTRLNIQYAKCLNQSFHVCNNTRATTLPSTCNQRLSLTALLNFVTVQRYVTPSTTSPQGTIVTEACLRMNNSGTVVRAVSLPTQRFSLEFHVKMLSTGGVLVAYVTDANTFFVLGCSGSEFVVFAAGVKIQTGLTITLNVWTQVLVSWHSALATVEIYVTDLNGLVAFKAVRLQADVFPPGGVLTFGLPPQGLGVATNVGMFRGMIDEVRVWSRPTNPSVVSQTWRMAVKGTTPDLHLHWPLNDGTGMAASERRRRSTMYAVDVKNPPTWEVSDLTLVAKERQESGVFAEVEQAASDTVFPVKPGSNAALEAQTTCNNLLRNVTGIPQCSGTFPDTQSLEEQCSDMVHSTGSSLNAELFALALAQFCQEKQELTASPLQSQCNHLQHVGSVLPYYGPRCDSGCMFGWTPGLASCLCYHGYWGVSCSQLCPFTARGVCSSNGQCSSQAGTCTCSPRWLHSSVTTQNYWTNAVTVTDVGNACTTCTDEWRGGDCSMTVTKVVEEGVWRAALSFSNYLTTWDGASVRLVTPGTYNLIQVEGVKVTALFLPCPHIRLCRFVSRVSVSVETVHILVSVGLRGSNNFTVAVYAEDKLQDFFFPMAKTFGRVALTWKVRGYLRVTVDDKLSVLISSSPAGLSVGARVHRDWFTKTSGLLGTPDGNHINDILPSTVVSDTEITAAKVSEHQRRSFMLTDQEIATKLGDVLAGQNLSSCGHMLRLAHHRVTFANLNAAVTKQLTLTLWVRSDTLLSSSTAILEITTSVGVISVSLHQHVILLTWFRTETASLRPDHIQKWTYLAVTWDGSAGSLTAFAIQETGFDYATLTTTAVSQHQFHILNVQLLGPQSNDAAVEVELLRVWQAAKPLESIAQDLKVYAADPDLDPKTSLPVLVMSASFDEGEGSSTAMSVHSSTTSVNMSGVIDVTGPSALAPSSVWRPSTIPVLDVIMPDDVFRTADTNTSAQACLAALQEQKLDHLCSDLHAFISVYLEACVREHQRTGNANMTSTVANMLAFYCQTTNHLGECELDGYVDFCQQVGEDVFPVWAIIVICVAILLLGSCCCCFVAFVVTKKKKKRKHERSLAGAVSRLSFEAETSFSGERIPDQGLGSSDHGFVNPAFGRGFPHAVAPVATSGAKVKVKGARSKTSEKEKGKAGTRPESGGGFRGVSLMGGTSRPGSSSSERPGSSFDERPHLEAWSVPLKRKQPTRGKEQNLREDTPRDPRAPLGFYTSHDPQGSEMFIYSPEKNQQIMASVAREGSSASLGDTTLHFEDRRARSLGQDMYRLQSVQDAEKIMVDDLELEEPRPVVFRHHGDDLSEGHRARGSRRSARSGRPRTSQTTQHINLAFSDED